MYFLTSPYTDLRWEEIPYVLNNLKKLGLREKELKT